MGTQNILAGLIATTDGSVGYSFARMTDENDEATESSYGSAINATYVKFDIGAVKKVWDLQFVYYDRAGVYSVAVSEDDSNYETVFTSPVHTADNVSKTKQDTGWLSVNKDCRYIKVSRSGSGIATIPIIEIRAHALVENTPDPTPPPTPTPGTDPTPTQDPSPTPGAGIPRGYIVDTVNELKSAELTFDGTAAMPAARMTDGDYTTNAVIGTNTYIKYDFGSLKNVGVLRCYYYDRSGDYTISASTDDVNYDTITIFSGSANAANQVACDTGNIAVNNEYRYIKISRSTAGVSSILELEVFSLVPGYSIESIGSITLNGELELILNDTFGETADSSWFTVINTDTQAAETLKVERVEDDKIYVSFEDNLLHGTEYELGFSGERVQQGASAAKKLSAQKITFTTPDKAVKIEQNDTGIILTNNTNSALNAFAVILEFNADGTLYNAPAAELVSVDLAAAIPYAKSADAAYAVVNVFIKNADFYIPVEKLKLH